MKRESLCPEESLIKETDGHSDKSLTDGSKDLDGGKFYKLDDGEKLHLKIKGCEGKARKKKPLSTELDSKNVVLIKPPPSTCIGATNSNIQQKVNSVVNSAVESDHDETIDGDDDVWKDFESGL